MCPFHSCLRWLFHYPGYAISVARWLRRKSEGHRVASGFPGACRGQHRPKARGSLEGRLHWVLRGSAYCRPPWRSSLSSGVCLIQEKTAGWPQSVACNSGVKTFLRDTDTQWALPLDKLGNFPSKRKGCIFCMLPRSLS